jgi:hypothetical protein
VRLGLVVIFAESIVIDSSHPTALHTFHTTGLLFSTRCGTAAALVH